jgi:hypothetical protein
MFKQLQQAVVLLALAGVPLIACQQRQEADDDDADTIEIEDTDTMVLPPPTTPTDAGADTAMGADTATMSGAADAPAVVEVVITNPMPHAMIVVADWGQGQEPLGTVQPNDSQTFPVSAPEGAQVKLTATDAEETHSPTGTLSVKKGEPANWTIQ